MTNGFEDNPLIRALTLLRRTVVVLIVVVILATGLQVAFALAPLLSFITPKPKPAASPPGGRSRVTSTKAAGGPMVTTLGYGFALNKGSTLVREWITLHDSVLPADIEDSAGLKVVYKAGGTYSRGEYEYVGKFRLQVKEPLAALDVMFLTFDVWGTPLRGLRFGRVQDVEAGFHDFDGAWSILDENEASAFYASIAYVSRVRTKSGRILEADNSDIAEEVKKFSTRFKVADLTSSPKPRGN